MMSELPPAEMNGSGMPVTGNSPTTTPMLMNAWMLIQDVMPAGEQRAERVRRPKGRADAKVREREEQHDDDDPARPARTPRR